MKTIVIFRFLDCNNEPQLRHMQRVNDDTNQIQSGEVNLRGENSAITRCR